ncbi:MAG: ABC transporter permease [Rhodothermales bacterium]
MFNSKRNIPLFQLAWRNTRRNIRRTLLTVSAVVVAVAAMLFGLSYMGGVMDNILDTYARTESGHVRIRQAGYAKRERSMPLHLNIKSLPEVLEVLRSQPNVEEALPRIRTAVLVDGAGSNKPGLLMGMDLAREEGYFNPADMVLEGRMPKAGEPEMMIGKLFAEKLNVHVGDTLILLGQTSYRSMGGMRGVITGLATTGLGHLDKRLLVASIDQVQYMTELPDATTEILVFAKDPLLADSMVTSLGAAVRPIVNEVEVLSWKDQGPLIQLIETNKPISNAILFILMLMAGLVIVNTMLMTVMERTQELGMMAAMGMRKSNIVSLIVIEGAIIGLIGALIGGSISTVLTLYLEQNGMDMTEAVGDIELPFQGIVYPDWTISYALISVFLGMLAAGVAALYPAWRATLKKPAEALRK